MLRALIFLLVAACAKAPAPVPSVQPAQPPTPATRPPPPPPPPRFQATPQPPPDAVREFVRAHANDAAPPRAFVYEIASSREGKAPHFLGHSITRRSTVDATAAAELERRLGLDTAYVDGDYGCVGDPVGFRLARGTATLDFIVDCGHFSLGEDGGHAAILSRDMISFLDRLRDAK